MKTTMLKEISIPHAIFVIVKDGRAVIAFNSCTEAMEWRGSRDTTVYTIDRVMCGGLTVDELINNRINANNINTGVK